METENQQRKRKYDSVSKTSKVICRVCQKQLLEQNYGRHLTTWHRGEDPKDRRPFGVNKISFSVVNKNVEKREQDQGGQDSECVEDGKESLSECEEEFFNEENNSFIEQEKVGDDDIRVNVNGIDVDKIENKIDKIMEQMNIVGNNNNGEHSKIDSLEKKLDIISAKVNVKEKVDDLTKAIEDMKQISLSEVKEEKVLTEVIDIKTVLKSCRTVYEIEAKIPEFQYDELACAVVCSVCNTSFK